MNATPMYPVFAFQRDDNMIYVFSEDRSLKSTSVDFLKNNGYEDSTIIDSSGTLYRIRSAYKVKYRGLWGFNPLLKGRQILVEFDYEPETGTISLEEFKKDVIRRIHKTKHIWQSAWDISELIDEVKESDSFEAIAMLLK